MPIKELKLKNFDSYKTAKIIFDKGVNVIIGTTDSGKTRIVEALRWVARNKPSGDEFKSTWTKDGTTSVTIKVNDNIARRSKGKRNLYTLKEKGKKKKEFVAFGQRVPEDIEKAIGLKDINFQQQHDPPFLLSLNPGERARYLNEITNLDIIDRSQKSIARRLNKDKGGRDREKENVSSYKKNLKKFKWLVNAEDDLRKLETLQRQISTIERSIKKTVYIIECIEEIREDIKKINKTTKFEGEVKRLLSIKEKLIEEEKELERMSELVEKIKEVNDQIKAVKKREKELEKMFNQMMPNTCPLCSQEIVK